MLVCSECIQPPVAVSLPLFFVSISIEDFRLALVDQLYVDADRDEQAISDESEEEWEHALSVTITMPSHITNLSVG